MRRRSVASENDFQRNVVRVAHLYGWCGHHNRHSEGSVQGVHFQRADEHDDAYGWPDWIFWCASRRRFLVRELKTDEGVLSRHQKRVLADLQACGVDAEVWRPRDWDAIVETFRH